MKKTISLLLTIILSSVTFAANVEKLIEGEHYKVVSANQSEKPKVTEYFNYGCGACYRVEGTISTWLSANSKDIEFERVPVELNPAWKIYVEAYYIAEMLNMLETVHSRIFHRIHVENIQITSMEKLKEFFVELGADPKQFDKVAKSFQLKTKVSAARKKAISMQVSSTPSFVVNNRYNFILKKFPSYLDALNSAAKFSKENH